MSELKEIYKTEKKEFFVKKRDKKLNVVTEKDFIESDFIDFIDFMDFIEVIL